jgi:hypothetical protein
MDSNHTIAKANKTVVSGVAAGIRGLNGKKGGKLRDQEQYAIPIDSAKLVKNTVVLEWKLGKNNTSGHLKITNAATEEVIVDKTVEGTGTLILKLENDGWYDWELTSVLDNKTIASNSFVKLSAIQTKNELAALDEFKKSLINFDEESKSLLIDDYLEQHLLELN